MSPEPDDAAPTEAMPPAASRGHERFLPAHAGEATIPNGDRKHGADYSENRTGGSGAQCGVGVSKRRRRSKHAGAQVQHEIAQLAISLLDHTAKKEQRQHVEQDMQETEMDEHRRYQSPPL